MILGIDEVGRGPWAGPLVVGAVVLGCEIDGLTDSKKLSKKKRELLDLEIRQKALGFGIGWVDAVEIDKIGLSDALKQATIRAVSQINTSYSEIIIDGTVNFLKETNKGKYVKTLKKADLLIPSVSAASIIAKVARDNFMIEQDELYPEYGFASHVGYGTAKHIKAIDEYGVTPLHRLSFAPLAKYNTNKDLIEDGTVKIACTKETSKQIGNAAEDTAAKYLKQIGHKIIDRNWKTKSCEIDIISVNKDVVYFTEVKYRKDIKHGGGLMAVDKAKLRQMKFAAEYYIQTHSEFDKLNKQLMVISLTGKDYVIERVLEI